MTESEKRQAAIDELADLGFPRDLSAPAFYRVAWRFGGSVRPPMFQSYRGALLTHGLGFGGFFVVFMEVLMFFALAAGPEGPVLFLMAGVIPVVGLVLGLAIGLAGAGYYRALRRDLRVPPWPAYRPGTGQIVYSVAERPGTPRRARWKIVNRFLGAMVLANLVWLGTWATAVLTGEPVALLDTVNERYLVRTRGREVRYVKVSPRMHGLLKAEQFLCYGLIVLMLPLSVWAGPYDYSRSGRKTPRGGDDRFEVTPR